MFSRRHLITVTVFVLYTFLFTPAYHLSEDSAMIPGIAITALCGWFYGPLIGIASTAPLIVINFALIHRAAGEIEVARTAFNTVGIILGLLASYSTGMIRRSCDRLNQLRSSQSASIEQATRERDALARLLIERDEQERTQLGQDLHDGAGQHLTGMLLHSESLCIQLYKTIPDVQSLAKCLNQEIADSLYTIRHMARSLQPIQLRNTTLSQTLDETLTFYTENFTARVSRSSSGDIDLIPLSTAQNLYRIIHEVLHRSVYNLKMKDVHIAIEAGAGICRCGIRAEHPKGLAIAENEIVSNVMEFRIALFGGCHLFISLPKGGYRLEYRLRIDKADAA